MVEYNVPVALVDPAWIKINHLFDQIVFCFNQRREAVLTVYAT